MLSARGPSVTICKINNVNLKTSSTETTFKFEIAAAGDGKLVGVEEMRRFADFRAGGTRRAAARVRRRAARSTASMDDSVGYARHETDKLRRS